MPCHRTVLARPEGTIHVIDAATRAPIPGATVTVARYRLGPPPRVETDRWTLTTDSSGAASTSLADRGEWVMPLMMHGVPQWAWEVCVSAPGHSAVVATWVIQHEWSRPAVDGRAAPRVEIALPEGNTPCPADGVHMETYPAGATGLDDRWKNDVPK